MKNPYDVPEMKAALDSTTAQNVDSMIAACEDEFKKAIAADDYEGAIGASIAKKMFQAKKQTLTN